MREAGGRGRQDSQNEADVYGRSVRRHDSGHVGPALEVTFVILTDRHG